MTSVSAVPTPSSNTNLLEPGEDCSNVEDIVYVTQGEYGRLLEIAGQYATLCQNLISGGVSEETLVLLSNPQTPRPRPESLSRPRPTIAHEHHARIEQESRSPFNDLAAPNNLESDNWDAEENSDDGNESVPEARDPLQQEQPQQCLNNHGEQPHVPPGQPRRTLLLSNLPEGVTHADLTTIIRGGQLLDMYVKYKDRSAQVSFVRAEDAVAFLDHVRKHDFYFKQKRIHVDWYERQFTLRHHINRNISKGASRNLVIRRCNSTLTEGNVREDLEHIHNLVVISIRRIGTDCFISTNSVPHAMFAKTCMMSRLLYKNSRIEFDVDECSQSIQNMTLRAVRVVPAPPNPTPELPLNRFELLAFE